MVEGKELRVAPLSNLRLNKYFAPVDGIYGWMCGACAVHISRQYHAHASLTQILHQLI